MECGGSIVKPSNNLPADFFCELYQAGSPCHEYVSMLQLDFAETEELAAANCFPANFDEERKNAVGTIHAWCAEAHIELPVWKAH